MERALEISKFWIQEPSLSITPINPKVALITNEGQNFILKKKENPDQFIAEIKLLTTLSKHNIKVQRPLQTLEGNYFVSYKNTHYCMYEYLVGSVLEVKDIIQVIFIAYFINSPEILKINQDMFLWIYENKKIIDECVQAVAIN